MDSRDDRKRLSQYARNLAASRHLYRVSMLARVESEEDIPFWQQVFSMARPDLKVKFLPSEDGNGSDVRQRGKTVCMRYVPYLNKHLVICVDSDFDRFTRPGVLTADKFVFQTYTYSFENHFCLAAALQQRWEELQLSDFDFRTFLSGLSHILYPTLIEMLTVKAAKKKSWNLTELCGAILRIQANRVGLLDHNGQQLLDEIQAAVESWRRNQVHPAKTACSKMEALAHRLGMTEENVYLYMQGHCIFNLVLRIGNALCYDKNDFRYAVLMQSLDGCNSPEMNLILSDLERL